MRPHDPVPANAKGCPPVDCGAGQDAGAASRGCETAGHVGVRIQGYEGLDRFDGLDPVGLDRDEYFGCLVVPVGLECADQGADLALGIVQQPDLGHTDTVHVQFPTGLPADRPRDVAHQIIDLPAS